MFGLYHISFEAVLSGLCHTANEESVISAFLVSEQHFGEIC